MHNYAQKGTIFNLIFSVKNANRLADLNQGISGMPYHRQRASDGIFIPIGVLPVFS